MTRIQITGIKLQNPPEEHIWVKSDTNVTITGITINTPGVSGKNPPKNTDGVDVTATGMFFCNNNIVAGDDNIAMSGTNLYIGFSTFGVGHGCSIGSITQNGVSNVTVDHLTMNGTTSGIRMKSARDRGGLVHEPDLLEHHHDQRSEPGVHHVVLPDAAHRSDHRHRDGHHRDHADLAEHHDQEPDRDRFDQRRDHLGPARGEDLRRSRSTT